MQIYTKFLNYMQTWKNNSCFSAVARKKQASGQFCNYQIEIITINLDFLRLKNI